MSSMTSPGESGLYAFYKIGDKVKDSSVARQIVENELTENKEPYYRFDFLVHSKKILTLFFQNNTFIFVQVSLQAC